MGIATILAKCVTFLCVHVAILLYVIGSPHPPPTNPTPTPLLMKYAVINLRQHETYLKVIMVCTIIT